MSAKTIAAFKRIQEARVALGNAAIHYPFERGPDIGVRCWAPRPAGKREQPTEPPPARVEMAEGVRKQARELERIGLQCSKDARALMLLAKELEQ